MPVLTRGPLPPRVYWIRRTLVLGTAVLLVIAIARLLGLGSDAKGGDDAAELSAGSPSSTLSSTSASTPTVVDSTTPATPGVTSTTTGKPGKAAKTSTAPVLVDPTGECAGSDIAVTPKVGHAVGGRDVMIVLQLRTIEAEACTWRVDPEALAVNITSGHDQIWSSRQCPRAIPRRDVVVRKAVTTRVGIVWRGAKRSGDTCIIGTDWAYPGWYHVTAAALGGEPSDLQFELTTPTAGTVTVTATPTQSPSGEATGSASGSSSGAVEPD